MNKKIDVHDINVEVVGSPQFRSHNTLEKVFYLDASDGLSGKQGSRDVETMGGHASAGVVGGELDVVVNPCLNCI